MKKKITPEDQRILQRKFPKFTKITACYCNNPAYGVSLSPEAKRWLNRQKNAVKTKPKSKVVSVRIAEDRADVLKKYAEAKGMSVTDLVEAAINFAILEAKIESAVCEGLSEQDGNMQEDLRET